MIDVAVDPQIRLLAAEMLESAVRSTEYILRLDRSQPTFDPDLKKHDALFDERFFEAFESLVWLNSTASTTYFEALDLDPAWGRENLHLGHHIQVALGLLPEYRPLLIELYSAMGRQIARQFQKRILGQQLRDYAEGELNAAIVLLAPLSHGGISIPGTTSSSEIIPSQRPNQSTEPPPGTT